MQADFHHGLLDELAGVVQNVVDVVLYAIE
jgi:hypothetical protein